MEEVYYHSKSKGEDMPVSEMSDLYVRRAFKKMIQKEKKRFDEKEKQKCSYGMRLTVWKGRWKNESG